MMKFFLIILKIGFWLLLTLTGLLFLIILFKTFFSIFGNFHDEKGNVEVKISILFKVIQLSVFYNLKVIIFRLYFGKYFLSFKKPAKKIKQTKTKPKKPKKLKKKKFHLTFKDSIYLGKKYIPRLFKLIGKEECYVDLKIGLKNPAYTGMMMGAYYSIKNLTPGINNFTLKPNFQKKGVGGQIKISGSIRLIKLIIICILIFIEIRGKGVPSHRDLKK